jgi:NADH:ubiquinone oxidoreductase subunit 4 (subunit M)
MPKLVAAFLLSHARVRGLPGMNGFVGEFLICSDRSASKFDPRAQ